MTNPTPEDLKQAFKDALRETLDEERDLLRSVLVEALEDLGMAEAIREGLKSSPVDREKVMSTLKGSA